MQLVITQRPKRIVRALMVLSLSASLVGCSEVAATFNGEVLLDPSKIEQNIKDGIEEQSGVTVDVECPDPMSAQVGDSRQCVARDDYGNSALVQVTVQNRDGYVIWKVLD